MADLSTVAISAVTSTAFVGALGFALREWLTSSLKRRVDAYVETLKHDLQREALKAELSTKQKHTIYPRLAAKLRSAEGALLELVNPSEPNWMELDEQEITKEMVRMRLPGRHRAALLEHVRKDRNIAFVELQLAAKQAGYEKAKRLATAAKSFVVLNSLYLSHPVHSAAHDAAQRMFNAAFELEVIQNAQLLHLHAEELKAELASLEAVMQGELHPKEPGSKGERPIRRRWFR